MDYYRLSASYDVRKIVKEDLPEVLSLCLENPGYYQYCPSAATLESLEQSLHDLPPGKSHEDKYFLGFYQNKQLIAVMDLICGYPHHHIAFIGFFMVNRSCQGLGVGTAIISECSAHLRGIGYSKIRLAYVENNSQAKAFWRKNNFIPTGIKVKKDPYLILVMDRIL